MLSDPAFFCDVWDEGGRLVGFFAYSTDAAGAFRRALRGHAVSLALAAIGGVVARPARLRVLLQVVRSLAPGYRELAADVPAEILSLAVLPEYRRASIGRQLASHALEVLDRSGAERVKAVTKTEEQDPYINPFWGRLRIPPRRKNGALRARAEHARAPRPARGADWPR